jgi:hypothetical protein
MFIAFRDFRRHPLLTEVSTGSTVKNNETVDTNETHPKILPGLYFLVDNTQNAHKSVAHTRAFREIFIMEEDAAVDAILVCLEEKDWPKASSLIAESALDKHKASQFVIAAADNLAPKSIFEALVAKGCDLNEASEEEVGSYCVDIMIYVTFRKLRIHPTLEEDVCPCVGCYMFVLL